MGYTEELERRNRFPNDKITTDREGEKGSRGSSVFVRPPEGVPPDVSSGPDGARSPDSSSNVVDELVTPGCPRCAIKHLTAALAYLIDKASGNGFRRWAEFRLSVDGGTGSVAVAKAHANLIEVLEGYRTHLPFAVGCLQVAEEALTGEAPVDVIRDIRCGLIANGSRDSVVDAVRRLSDLLSPYRYARTVAHVDEALRELPVLEPPDRELMELLDPLNPHSVHTAEEVRVKFAEYVSKSVKWIEDEYFNDN